MAERIANCPNQEKPNLDSLNHSIKKTPSSRYSVSSASSSNSDSSDEADITTPINDGEVLPGTNSDPKNENPKDTLNRKLHSLVDDQTEDNNENECQVFPSLPDSVLQKLGLLGENSGDRLGEQEMEEKFTALALAFSIDVATITDRWDRQQRNRDQTEANFNKEIEKLTLLVQEIQPLCVDAERAELLTGLLAQMSNVVSASSHATTAAEKFGAVQHEYRLAQSAHLMINYVTLLKQQRDSARKQFQYTKRVLQHADSSDSLKLNKERVSPPPSLNGNKISTKRRASIATITQSSDKDSTPNPEIRRFTRRTSDLSGRLSTLARTSRPSRLELGVDLSKIKEGIAENDALTRQNSQEHQNPSENQTGSKLAEQSVNAYTINEFQELDTINFTKRERIVYNIKKLHYKIRNKYTTWAVDGTLHEFFSVGAIVCFSLSLIILGNLMIEMEYSQSNYT